MRDDGKSKGIGFVGFEKASSAQAAMDAQDDLEVDGRKIGISWANERKEGGGRDRESRGGDRESRGGDREERGGDRSRSRHDGETKFTCFVGNLGFKTSEGQIKDFFKGIGNVKEVRVGKHDDGRSKGFAHVDFESKEDLTEALTLNGKDLDGRDVKLDESKPFSRDGGRGGRGGGFRGGRGGSRDGGGYRGGRGGSSGGYRGGRDRDGGRREGGRDGGRDRDSYRR
jgi:nucleolin